MTTPRYIVVLIYIFVIDFLAAKYYPTPLAVFQFQKIKNVYYLRTREYNIYMRDPSISKTRLYSIKFNWFTITYLYMGQRHAWCLRSSSNFRTYVINCGISTYIFFTVICEDTSSQQTYYHKNKHQTDNFS